jgi:hypothetical protein
MGIYTLVRSVHVYPFWRENEYMYFRHVGTFFYTLILTFPRIPPQIYYKYIVYTPIILLKGLSHKIINA